MSVADKNTRVVVTIPRVEAEAFRKDADELGMTLSKYVYLVLTSWSNNVPESFRDYANEYLTLAQETPEQRERFWQFCMSHSRER